jgi:single-strand DNA-binding protein
MPSLNKVILIGRLTRDPELRYTSSGLAVASFSIAVDRRFKDQQTGERKTDFFRCTAWRQKAEFVQQYIQKGRLVCVEGSIELNEFTSQDGSKRLSADVQCDNIETLDAARDGEGGGQGGQSGGGYQNRQSGGGQDDGGGQYFDDEMGAAPAAAPARSQNASTAPQQRQAAPQRSQGAPQGGQGGQSQRPQPAGAGAGTGAGKSGAAPQAAYPQNDYDFDDSDPFADE